MNRPTLPGWTRVTLCFPSPGNATTRVQKNSVIVAWLRTTVAFEDMQYHYEEGVPNTHTHHYDFRHKNDALLFKLTWGGS